MRAAAVVETELNETPCNETSDRRRLDHSDVQQIYSYELCYNENMKKKWKQCLTSC